MKSTVESVSAVQRRVKVSVPSETVNDKFSVSYRKLQKKAKIQGFRQGKAPLYIVKKLYKDSVMQEVKSSLIQDNIFEALQSHNVSPISQPVLDSYKDPVVDGDFEFSAVVDILPIINLKDAFDDLKVAVVANKFDLDKSLKNSLTELSKEHAVKSASTAGQFIENGDFVSISYTASSEGKNIAALAANNLEIFIGEKKIIQEFETALIGMKKSETKTLELTITDAYVDKILSGNKLLLGKKLLFVLVVNSFSKLDIPTINDDFAKDLKFDSLTVLKDHLTARLSSQNESFYLKEKEAALFTALREKLNFIVPATITDRVVDDMIEKRYQEFKKGQGLDKYLKDQTIRSQMLPEAGITAKNTMILWETIKEFKLEVSEEEIKNHIRSYLPNEKDRTDSKVNSLLSKMGSNLKEGLLFSKASQLIMEKANFIEK